MTQTLQLRKSLSPTQKRIQQAALRLFVEKGVDRVNVKELAHCAKVARGTIYNNQRASTEQIFQEIAILGEEHPEVFSGHAFGLHQHDFPSKAGNVGNF